MVSRPQRASWVGRALQARRVGQRVLAVGSENPPTYAASAQTNVMTGVEGHSGRCDGPAWMILLS